MWVRTSPGSQIALRTLREQRQLESGSAPAGWKLRAQAIGLCVNIEASMVALFCLLACAPLEKPVLDKYALVWPYASASVTISGSLEDAVASALTRSGRHRRKQRLTLPHGWWPLNAMEPDSSVDNCDRPAVLRWPGVREPVLVLHVSPLMGVYETSALAVYEWNRGRWKLLNKNLWPYAYCDMGAFCFRGRRLHIWGPIYGDNYAHKDAHRFELDVFELRGNRVRLVSRRRTKRRYWPGTHSPPAPGPLRDPPDHVAAADDPLREFGLRWRWWGKPRTHGRRT